MGRDFRLQLSGRKVYVCSQCNTQLTVHSELISKSFRGRTGAAWLFGKVVNVSEGALEDRNMTTGKHTIADVYCNDCGTNVGWRYECASDLSQKYKEGKFILERALLKSVEEDERGQQRSAACVSSDLEFE
ncbi:zinc binding protein [Cystoisospora suis]|uniref:Protein yippee-like n=1 Tax=Cystoisospora suis TaxID=483139 RepID=A0A2C6L4J6_9APIC|nr:zinc binding protein [Cystoisospora suis]